MLLRLFALSLLVPFALTADTTQTESSSSHATSAHAAATTTTATTSHQTRSKADAPQYSTWSKDLHSLLTRIDIPALFPSPTRKLNISIPQSLKGGPLMTAVPASVILNLIGDKYRTSVQKRFADGDFPDWYKTMDPDAKEFFTNFASSLKEGKTAVWVTETDKEAPSKTDDNAASETSAEDDATRVLDRSVLTMVFGTAGLAALMMAL